MKYAVQELKKHYHDPIIIDEEVDLKDSLTKRHPALIDITPVKITGLLSPTKSDTVAQLRVQAILTIPSTRSLEPVDFPVDFEIDEVYVTEEQVAVLGETNDDMVVLTTSTLDLTKAVEDYLLLAIPTQILTPAEERGEEMPKGMFWEVLSEEEFANQKQATKENNVDPRLAKLGDLFKDSDE